VICPQVLAPMAFRLHKVYRYPAASSTVSKQTSKASWSWSPSSYVVDPRWSCRKAKAFTKKIAPKTQNQFFLDFFITSLGFPGEGVHFWPLATRLVRI
jgi:hypothetical protein